MRNNYINTYLEDLEEEIETLMAQGMPRNEAIIQAKKNITMGVGPINKETIKKVPKNEI